MEANTKPKSALLAYCALADRLTKSQVGLTQALTPFFVEACRPFSGETFDAAKFSGAVADRFGIFIPRLAALGLAEHLEKEGVLIPLSGYASNTVYRYSQLDQIADDTAVSAVTEGEIDGVLKSFIDFCRTDPLLAGCEDESLQAEFLDRLLHADSMRLLSRREMSIAAKKSATTLVLKKTEGDADPREKVALHLDYLVSQYLLDLRDKNVSAFDRVSDIAFANMAAEALACFSEPAGQKSSLEGLTVYLDSPLLLDMLGVNTGYEDYGQELLKSINASGATVAVLDHCVMEAEAVVAAQLAYLRSGINQIGANWGTTARPDLLSALINNVGSRASERLGIAVHRDPEANLHRRSPATCGDIEAEMTSRMQNWRNADSREYDRKSVWAMLSIRDVTDPCPRICDAQSLLLSRNTALVNIANNAWRAWLKGLTRHSQVHIERWAPVAMSDKQFAGYLWLRGGSTNGAMSKARLLAHCSSAVRPRADVKARAYNLALELSGKKEADDVAALLEDREGSRALMRATRGDPADITPERLPYILEEVKISAGEYAAALVRAESKKELEGVKAAHASEIQAAHRLVNEANALRERQANEAASALTQKELDEEALLAQHVALQKEIARLAEIERDRRMHIYQRGFHAGRQAYRTMRWVSVLTVAAIAFVVTLLSEKHILLAAVGVCVLTGFTFWFVPEHLEKPMTKMSRKVLRRKIQSLDLRLDIPCVEVNFKHKLWDLPGDTPQLTAVLDASPERLSTKR